MPGLNKTFHQMFVEIFCLTFNIAIYDEQFEEIMSNSCYYPIVSEIVFEFDFLPDDVFSELSSNLINFCNTEARVIVDAIHINFDIQEITLDITENEPRLKLMRKLEEMWPKKMSNL